MKGSLIFPATVAAIAIAIVVGLFFVGGPLQGQRDKFDTQRYLELSKLGRALLCEQSARVDALPLPQALSVEAFRVHCSSAGIAADDLFDDETGAPYVYKRISDQDFAICATFHDAERTLRLIGPVRVGGVFDPATGCISGLVR